jgi:hypothetical protein
MSKKKSTTRTKVRKMQREKASAANKHFAKLLGMPKGLRQYFARLGVEAQSVVMEYRKYAGYKV